MARRIEAHVCAFGVNETYARRYVGLDRKVLTIFFRNAGMLGQNEWQDRNSLVEGEAIGVVVKPSEVRLKFREEQAQYAWKFNYKSLVPLFDKHLSKHSVGAYKQLHREAGKGFYAVDPKDIPEDTPQPDITEQVLCLETERADLVLRLAEAEQLIVALEATRVQHEEVISTQKSIIQEAQASVNFYEQDIQKWMLKVDIYEKSTI
ncbi:hypothetical protein IFM51744_10512 [Aspergillus udagawae]|nr:hypothetical protein IFM51744_10512 [Aspergillus udagawae]